MLSPVSAKGAHQARERLREGLRASSSAKGGEQRAPERGHHPTGCERVGSPALQTLQELILLTPWVCFRAGGSPNPSVWGRGRSGGYAIRALGAYPSCGAGPPPEGTAPGRAMLAVFFRPRNLPLLFARRVQRVERALPRARPHGAVRALGAGQRAEALRPRALQRVAPYDKELAGRNYDESTGFTTRTKQVEVLTDGTRPSGLALRESRPAEKSEAKLSTPWSTTQPHPPPPPPTASQSLGKGGGLLQ
jgi:hypothetical protein